jgi:antirestriction protein ArdC
MMGNYPVRFGGRERRVLTEARPSRPNAEMGSAFLCAALGIVPTVRHADYIGSWLEVLREDHRAIFRAASAASKAADWLLARHREAQGARQDGRAAA